MSLFPVTGSEQYVHPDGRLTVAGMKLLQSIRGNLIDALSEFNGDRASYDIGTVTSGTTTLDYENGTIQRMVNGGASTLAPPSSGEGAITLEITNNASAGALTTSGFDSVTGDAFDTTDTNRFLCTVTVVNGESYLDVLANGGNV